MPPIVRDDDIYHEVSSVGLEDLDDEGWSRLQPLAGKPSLDRYFGQKLATLGWSFGRKHLLGSVKLSLQYESLRWSATTSIEKIAFARKRLSIAAIDRQRSAQIVATVTMG